MKNFQFIGITLAKIWSQLIADNFLTVAEFIDSTESKLHEKPAAVQRSEMVWYAHANKPIPDTNVKCTDNKCCSKPRSSYFSVVTERCLPPLPAVQTSRGLKIPKRVIYGASHNCPSLFAAKSLKADDILPCFSNPYTFPYDLYCVSVESVLSIRICKKCQMYLMS